MKLAALVEIRRRSRTLPQPHVDPLQAIYQRCQAAPETLENKTLIRIALAIEEESAEFDEREVLALPQEALRLLDALIERRDQLTISAVAVTQSGAQ